MKYKHTVIEWWYGEIKEKMENGYEDYKIAWIIHHWWFIQVFMEKEITDEEYEKEVQENKRMEELKREAREFMYF